MQALSESNMLDLLTKLDQSHIVSEYQKCEDQSKKDKLLAQVNKLNMNYPGGISGYSDVAKKLCVDLKEGVNPWDGWELKIPSGINLAQNPTESLDHEKIN